jgi:hypothetical protein
MTEDNKQHTKFLHVSDGRESSDLIATRYGLEGPGIESRWGEIFLTRPDGPFPLYNGYRAFPRIKKAVVQRWPLHLTLMSKKE